MEAIMMVGGFLRTLDIAMQVFAVGRQGRQPWWWVGGCWPAMDTAMVVSGGWPAVDTEMELMVAGQQWI